MISQENFLSNFVILAYSLYEDDVSPPTLLLHIEQSSKLEFHAILQNKRNIAPFSSQKKHIMVIMSQLKIIFPSER